MRQEKSCLIVKATWMYFPTYDTSNVKIALLYTIKVDDSWNITPMLTFRSTNFPKIIHS